MKENVRFWGKYRVVTPYFDHLMKWNCVMKVWKKSELMLMRGKEKLLGFSVCLWLFIWTVILLDPLLFLLDRSSCVFLGWGVVGVGGVWIHLLLLLHIYTLPIIWLHWLLSRPCLTLFMNWHLSRPLFVVGWVVVGGGRGGGVWIHLLLLLHICTLPITWLLSRPLFVVGVGGGRG